MTPKEFATIVDVAALGYKMGDTEAIIQDPDVFRACVDQSRVVPSVRAGKLTSCVVGFPFGNPRPEDINRAILDGARELDIPIPLEHFNRISFNRRFRVINYWLEKWCHSLALPEDPRLIYKIILHTDLIGEIYKTDAVQVTLNLAQTIRIALEKYSSGQIMMKTCTGYGPGKAEPTIIEALTKDGWKVKASGGIRTLQDAKTLLDAGASLLGMSYKPFKAIMLEMGD